ncbi:MAG: hypothetical protein RDV48_07205 [Candidatus Eremiobacteraeota bacterium]|nr:hypothetical protein [Candidatus Eremiobacteraeota bacterium]
MMVALLLLALLIFSIGVLIPFSQLHMRQTTHRDMAYTYADILLNTVCGMNSGDIVPGTTFSGQPAHSGPSQFPPWPYPSVTHVSEYPSTDTAKSLTHTTEYFFTVTAAQESPIKPKVYVVTVNVSWREHGAKESEAQEKTITVSSKVTRKE